MQAEFEKKASGIQTASNSSWFEDEVKAFFLFPLADWSFFGVNPASGIRAKFESKGEQQCV